MEFLAWLENSAFSTWIRTTPSIFGYVGVLFLHTAGFAVVIGISLVLDLRILGAIREIPIAGLNRFFPVIWTGVCLNVCSGAVLFAQDATTRAGNPMFAIKLLLVALALGDTVLIQRAIGRPAIGSSASSGKGLALASLVLWLGVVTAGRMMAYVTQSG